MLQKNQKRNFGVPHFRVGLLLQTGQALMRGVCHGVYEFLRANRHWHIVGDGQYPLLQWDQLSEWEGDGLIGIANSSEQIEAMVAAGVPCVNAGSRIIDKRVRTVATDSAAIGQVAADHLLACGLKNFLYMSELKWENERIRHQAFSDTVTARGDHRCDLLNLPVNEYIALDASAHYRPDLDGIADALNQAGKPLGVCTPNSVLARIVVEVAQQCGYRVPDDIAVIGVNDDPLICESTNPHLSAVIQPAERIGYLAAELLELLMHGKPVAEKTTFVQPLGVADRRSTDMMATEDNDVRTALRFIRNNAHTPIEVADVADHVAISRPTLEIRFVKEIGKTPGIEHRRVRVELAKKLLAETSDSITNVVFAAGFNSRQVFCNRFRQDTGMSPSQYRTQSRLEPQKNGAETLHGNL